MGFPIRASPGQRLFAPIRRLTQPATPFIASRYQGIHHAPLVTWTRYLPPNRLSKIKKESDNPVYTLYYKHFRPVVKGRKTYSLSLYEFSLRCQYLCVTYCYIRPVSKLKVKKKANPALKVKFGPRNEVDHRHYFKKKAESCDRIFDTTANA